MQLYQKVVGRDMTVRCSVGKTMAGSRFSPRCPWAALATWRPEWDWHSAGEAEAEGQGWDRDHVNSGSCTHLHFNSSAPQPWCHATKASSLGLGMKAADP